ncbi:MAG: putative toxin-antitoxin system toxin component, PIN family [Desulfobacteraceae bacterium]
MKVVVDTNVLISAAFRDRLPEDVIMFLVSHPEFQWIATQDIVREYLDVLKRKKFSLTESIIRKWEQMVEEVIHIVPDSIVIEFPRDQKDARFISCALSADADFVITGDKDFSEAKRLTNTKILSVSMFKRLVVDRASLIHEGTPDENAGP